MYTFRDLVQMIYPHDWQDVVDNVEPLMKPVEHIDASEWDWYKSARLYVVYPDSFRVDTKQDLTTLKEQLPRIHQLGCNAIHILPFLKSPLFDAGFDIADYHLVRDDLGGNVAFDDLLGKAKHLGIRVFIDLVLNHTSNEHPWYLQAVQGSEFHRQLYTHSLLKPELINTYTDQDGKWATYRLSNKEVPIRIIFPEQAGPIPHWEEGMDGYWYYHTFYPHQLDVDWNNPSVFIEYAKVFTYWAQKGVNFRLDAIPFIAKDINSGVTESSKKNHLIVQALHLLVKSISPNSVFLVEANQPMQVTKEYFGTHMAVEADLAYNFQLTHALWIALTTHNPEPLWEVISQMQHIPEWGQWITFLRNHDQLSLEFMSDTQRIALYESLSPKGLPFMEGFGIGGRTASLLDCNHEKIILAHALLMSLPGLPAIYYGDEVGIANKLHYMEVSTHRKRLLDPGRPVAHDTRDINRGPIAGYELKDSEASALQKELKIIVKARDVFKNLATTYPQRIDSVGNLPIFAATYSFDGPDIQVYINLSADIITLNVDHMQRILLQWNQATVEHTQLTLPPYAGIWIMANNKSTYAQGS